MHVLFVHQAFPAQFGRLALELTKRHGWRCTCLVKDLTSCPLAQYCEYYFAPTHRDLTYRLDLPPAEPAPFYPRCINAATLVSLVAADAGHAPTHWQRQSFPARFHPKIEVHFDGVDTELYR